MRSRRHQRLGELLKRELGQILIREFGDAPDLGMITVHEVVLSGDLRIATAYVGIYGNPEVQERTWKELNRYRRHLQDILAHTLVLRRAPHLRFVLDHSVEKGTRVLQILEEIEKQNSPDQSES